jgi:hypothetical protein
VVLRAPSFSETTIYTVNEDFHKVKIEIFERQLTVSLGQALCQESVYRGRGLGGIAGRR